MPIRPTVLIVGAGIGGLAAGLALKRAGWNVRVFERSSAPREPGYALSLAPNALTALRELKVADAVVSRGVLITGGAVGEVRLTSGRVLRRATVKLSRELAVLTLRPMLHQCLLEALGTEPVILGSDVVRVGTTPSGATLTLRDGTEVDGDLLVGADGFNSVVRRCLHPGESPPRRSGFVEIRGLTSDVPPAFHNLTGILYFGRRILGAVARVSAKRWFWFMSLPADKAGAGPRDAGTLLTRSAADFDPAFREVVGLTSHQDLRIDDAVDRDPLPTWGRGRITLLGDAAHPMLPHAGQGAAQALEDAVALGLALGRGEAIESGLRWYEDVRGPRTRAIVMRGRRMARFQARTEATWLTWLRNGLVRWTPESAMLLLALTPRPQDPHRQLRARNSGISNG
jgi:2-polyprenyl-6-methoxyphenol hydroxylase-like FAD-dependent oxidoreductase